MQSSDQEIYNAFVTAAFFLKDKVECSGWKKFSSNYLREHARCQAGVKFTNSISPDMLRRLIKEYPELRHYITIGTLKE